MNSFTAGHSAGASGTSYEANPHEPESNDHLCWCNGWHHGRYSAAYKNAIRIKEVECPTCHAEGELIILPKNEHIWNPSGYIHGSGAPPDVHDVAMGFESVACDSCHTLFEYQLDDSL